MLTRKQKEDAVVVLRDKLQRANAVLVVDYRGLTVAEASDLRPGSAAPATARSSTG